MTHIINAINALPATKTRSVTVTLSRAHKINERINTKLAELRALVASKGQAVSVQSYAGEEQIDLIKAGAAAALAAVPTYVALAIAQASLRQAVGRANASTGISDLLTTVEKNKRLVSLCDALIAVAPNANTLSTDALSKRPVGEMIKDYGSVAVSSLSAAQLEPYAATKATLERENFALQDKLSDLNAHKVSFEVDEQIIDMLSLKAD